MDVTFAENTSFYPTNGNLSHQFNSQHEPIEPQNTLPTLQTLDISSHQQPLDASQSNQEESENPEQPLQSEVDVDEHSVECIPCFSRVYSKQKRPI